MGDRIRIRETRVRVAQRGEKVDESGDADGAGGVDGDDGGRHLVHGRRGRLEYDTVARRH